jgi:trigger factor
MTEEKLDIFAQPLPLENFDQQLDFMNPADYTFAFEVGLKPTLQIDPKNIHVTRHRVAVTDEMINEEVERLVVRHGKMTDPEEVTGDDNVLNVTFTESDAEGNAVEGGINKGNSVLVKYFNESYRPQLMGKKKDDSFVIQLNEAFDEKEREWIISDLGINKDDAASKYFNVNIGKVGLVERAEMNEDFFNLAFPEKGITDEAGFREAVKSTIQDQWEAQSRNQLHDQIYHQLLDHTPIEFPAEFLKRWMQKGGEELKTAEEAEQEYPAFSNSLKWNLITNELTNKYQIQVQPSEVKDFAKQQIMGYMGVKSLDDAPWMDSYAESMLKDKKFIESTYYQIQTTKMFDALEKEVNVTEDAVTPEQLTAMQHNHQH